ncbi:UDP-N-acetylmuramoyl-tripeptide--D-alanyl-D-alanine ligase [Enterococcus bulliens]
MKLSITEVAALFSANYSDPRMITGVEFDSRKIKPGNLFVPLAGTRDGHEFIEQAIENGAIATFWSQETSAPSTITAIVVPDVLAAFQTLATYYRDKTAPKVVAITGSNGKTTTKDMTESVLSQQFKTYKTQGNYNNEIGLPYTLLHMPSTTEVVVLEMGMDHAGDLTLLSAIAKPDITAITMIGEAHIENLGSRANIAAGKMEITAALAKDGVVIVPENEPLLQPLTAKLTQKTQTFGIQTGDLAAQILEETRDYTRFVVDGHLYQIPVIGSYNVTNALIAIAIGQLLGLSVEHIQHGLATFELTKQRTEWLKAFNGADLLSDVYNANPTAMSLVLDSFGKLDVSGKKIAVLADMLELGPDELAMHAQMIDHLNGYDEVYLYGTRMHALAELIPERYPELIHRLFEPTEKEALMQGLKQQLTPTDSVVFKGSNGMGLAEVVTFLQNN